MSRLSKIVKTTVTPIAICIAIAFAAPTLAHKGKDKNHQEMRQMLSELDLSAAQKQDIRQLMKQTREDRALFKDDGISVKQSLRSKVQSEQWQQSEVESLIAELQPILAKKALQRATNKHQIWSLLTNEQQTELAEIITEKKAHKKGKKANNRKGDRRLKRLDLSEEQLLAITSIKEAAKAEIQLTKANIKTFKQAERQLIQSANFSAAAWQSLWDEYQGDFAKAKVLKTKVQHDTWNVLTPDQQLKSIAKGKGKGKGKKTKYQD